MAVTQQLARVTAMQLAACRRSVAELDELCSFRSAPRYDYLDLNWWPATLERVWELTGADTATMSVLRRGFGSADEVNPAYRDYPTVWEHPVTAVEPDQVAEVADALRTMTPGAVHAVVSSSRDRALAEIVPDVTGDLAEIVAEQHAILRQFYDEAARRRLATVLWWD
ncbi:uncharacterized protein DUF1877 [Herbihabitans rhizosphaerae]|uniref:Uncharacterized protein DUF1877 n=1 Tax=Herbihabitans rhizosphaerae TaxID=1872711 RepID=A0A4Q7L4E9_9PSEU|nr:DUF1877 family protein [Herbihabitans rhizosphaerae]RZS43371.1 uncharacterized protein DUF1877 [Herbihabitans rhizosphaerae]